MCIRSLVQFLTAFLLPSVASAEVVDQGIAKDWQLGFQAPASPVMEQLVWLHDDFLLYIITAICVFVLVAMLYIMVRFNRRANPVPSKNSHNTLLEVVWTVVPVFILVAIAIPSLRTHYFMEKDTDFDMTIKVTGYQWYWGYEYPDHAGIAFESRIKEDKDLQPGEHRLLAVDNIVVVPVDTRIRLMITGADVIHAWAMPAFGVKRDAMPGRLNESWFMAAKTGRYYGQCSELCGVKHGFMPIVVDVVSKEEFAKWVESKKKHAALSSHTQTETAQLAQ